MERMESPDTATQQVLCQRLFRYRDVSVIAARCYYVHYSCGEMVRNGSRNNVLSGGTGASPGIQCSPHPARDNKGRRDDRHLKCCEPWPQPGIYT